jgi:acetylornithine deacetylase/succinyl-diaminopimelate desuccinylase-like protein
MDGTIQAVLGHVSEQRAIRRLQDMVRIAATPGEERPMAEYVAQALRESGCDSVYVDQQWNVLGALGPGSDPGLVLLTHTDSGGPGTMANAYSGEIMDGARFGKSGPVVYGRGACAPKASVAAMMEAAAALRDAGISLRRPLLIAAVTKDLRANHEGVKELVQTRPLRARYCIAGEPSDNHVVLGARGIGHFEITLTGVPAHWGRPADAANPLYGLADVLLKLERVTLPAHPILGGATIAPFEIRSEAVPPRSPDSATILLDRRLLPEESPQEVRQQLAQLVQDAIAARPKLSAAVVHLRGMYPYSVGADSPAVQLVQRAGQEALGRALPTMYIAFATNAAYVIRDLGIESVCFGPGRIGDASEIEHVEIASVMDAARVYAAAAVGAQGGA